MGEAWRRIGYVRSAAGDRFPGLDIESSPYFTEVTDNADAAIADLAKSSGIPADILADHPNVLIGSAAAVAETLQARREALHVNYVTVQQSQLELFAPIVARLTGR